MQKILALMICLFIGSCSNSQVLDKSKKEVNGEKVTESRYSVEVVEPEIKVFLPRIKNASTVCQNINKYLKMPDLKSKDAWEYYVEFPLEINAKGKLVTIDSSGYLSNDAVKLKSINSLARSISWEPGYKLLDKKHEKQYVTSNAYLGLHVFSTGIVHILVKSEKNDQQEYYCKQ